MNKKLYVGNLSYATTEGELQRLFAQIGPVTSVILVKDRLTGQSKGFGFVEMETTTAAQKAIKRLNNSMLNERALTVGEARVREPSFRGGGKSGDQNEKRGNSSRSSSYRDGGCRLY